MFTEKLGDDYQYVGAKVGKTDAKTFVDKVGPRNTSIVLRELIRMFNAGKIIVEIRQTIGGD